MTNLDALIEAVEAGDADACDSACRDMHRTKRDNGEHWPGHDAMKAFSGSLDASKRLHDALLPGWGWDVDDDGQALVFKYASSADSAPPDDYIGVRRDNPARAWLLSILRALKAGETEMKQGEDA